MCPSESSRIASLYEEDDNDDEIANDDFIVDVIIVGLLPFVAAVVIMTEGGTTLDRDPGTTTKADVVKNNTAVKRTMIQKVYKSNIMFMIYGI